MTWQGWSAVEARTAEAEVAALEAEVPEPVAQETAKRSGFQAWVLAHDDNKWFTAAYIGGAVVLSIAVSLFWLVAILAVHVAFDLARHRYSGASWRNGALETLWDLKLDIALVFFAFALSLYMDAALGLLGLSAASRVAGAAARSGAKVAAWQRILRGVLLSLDDAAQVGRAAVAAKQKRASHHDDDSQALAPTGRFGSWSGHYGRGDKVAVAIGFVCGALVVLAPALLGITPGDVVSILANELRPLP